MTVAVLLSTYNGAQYLPQQLESLANQTVADDMTVYVRDDGSSDASMDVLQKWSDRLKIVQIHGENRGPAMSFWELLMNESIQADYYAFCDQDDIWDADKLEVGIQHLHDDVHLYLSNCRLIDSTGHLLQEKLYSQVPRLSILRQFVCGGAQGCSMVLTNVLRSYFLKNKLECIPMHDAVLALHALGYGNIYWDITPRFSYRMHEQNVVAKTNKSFLERLRTTWWNWKNSSKHSMSDVAAELLDKPLKLTDQERKFVAHVASYKHSLGSKLYILFHAYSEDIPFRALNSYRIRVILNLY